jgi:hypothetical protein
MKKRFVIIHYNTPLLTECLVRSINLFVEDAFIYIFDNSDKQPFTASFDNVFVLDNTKGDIIDFDKWLKKYPNKNRSHGIVNAWGSAKHCYSVEKCMELIEDRFILLDSDILFKKDVSSLFDETMIYCGETITQPMSSVKRILPFLCFINVPMCKKYNVHYFDEKRMHGLWYSGIGDRYDTGGAFYLNASRFKHKDIKLDEYIIHYGHGSWNKSGEKPNILPTQWLNINKKYWKNEMNKKVVYTCITGGYDSLVEPKYVSEDFDYICFTDNPNLTSNVWNIKPLPKETEELSQVKKQRYVKINPHKLLKEYDLSIWVDGCVTLKGDLNELLDKTLKEDYSIYIPKHPNRNCIYTEAIVVVKMRKDKKENVDPQIDRYKQEGFPKDYGLLQSNILIRKHNNEDCIRLMEDWFNEIKNGSHRDQLSFNYASWKNKDIKISYLDKDIYKSKWFFWNGKHGVKPTIKTQTASTVSSTIKTIKRIPITLTLTKPIKKRLKSEDVCIYGNYN